MVMGDINAVSATQVAHENLLMNSGVLDGVRVLRGSASFPRGAVAAYAAGIGGGVQHASRHPPNFEPVKSGMEQNRCAQAQDAIPLV